MNTTPRQARLATAVASALVVLAGSAHAQIVVNDTLSGANSTYSWIPLGGACLTASANSRKPPTNYIPGCFASDFTYYSAKGSTLVGGDSGNLGSAADPIGKGALRLTNGDTTNNGTNGNQQTGAVVSSEGFPMSGGVQITWTSVTYGGNAYKPSGGNANGADGISFFLSDASAEPSGPTDAGGSGGSLGYSCSNTNGTFNGVRGGYLAVGIDEYGNFANSGDNTSTGRKDPTSGNTFWPGLISMRGAGDTNWYSFQASTKFAKYYPSGTNTQSVMNATCKAGYAINNSGSDQTDSTGKTVKNGKQAVNDGALPNYAYLVPLAYPAQFTIANQEAVATPKRSAAIPITFSVAITAAGKLTFSYAVNGGTNQPVFTDYDLVANNGALPAKVRFGFSAGTGGGSNVHEITCFKAQPNSQSETSAGSSALPTARIPGGAQIYLAFYNTKNWYGTLNAYGVDKDTAVVSSTANWEANCVLTGSTSATASTCSATTPDYTKRTILTWDDSTLKGVSLASATPSSISTALNTDNKGSDRLAYLLGNRSKEVSGSTGTFRPRTGLLGDIVDSSPVWLGPPQSPYTATFSDKLTAVVGPESSYPSFASTNVGRTNVVYVGSNDGMLHGFRAGTFDGTTYGGTNDGAELLAYMPNLVGQQIHASTPTLDFSSTAYAHNFFTDGTPGVGDLYYGGAWHTWLAAGLGAGGQATGPILNTTTTTSTTSIYMLDVTDPSQFSNGNAPKLVLGEWTPSTITCANDTSTSKCATHLGLTYGTPQIRRLHNKQWAVLFGNGLNSAAGTSGLFIGLVDSSSGAVTFRYLDTGAGKDTSGNLNGIQQITPVDLDGDHITDYVYAGDALGNVWRFDLTSATTSNWKAGAQPLFTTPSGQPITTSLAVAGVPVPAATGTPKIVVAFGTGQKFPLSAAGAETYNANTQAFYGIWDWNMSTWNSASSTKFDSITALPSPLTTILQTSLQTQTITTTTDSATNIQYRTSTSNAVCWYGSSGCTTATTGQFGWTMSLAAANATATPATLAEQAIFNPTVVGGEFVINTFIPPSATSAALQCTTPQAGGFTMAVQMANGGAPTTSFLPLPNGTFSQSVSVVGIGAAAVGTPAPITSSQGQSFIVSGTVTGGISRQQTNITGGTGSRVNWTKVR